MHSYADAHGSLPPSAIVSPDGKPLLSWRVLVLPFVEQQDLFKKFKLDEPWDSPHNIALLPLMPPTYRHFHGRAVPVPHSTYYRVFVGPGAAFEGPVGVSLQDFRDGTSTTLLIVEAGESVPWTKPEELSWAPDRPLPPLGGHFEGLFLAALADAQLASVPTTTSEEKLRAAITRSGGEKGTLLP